jgi:hypothetical protein
VLTRDERKESESKNMVTVKPVRAYEYERYDEVFPVGSRVRCECEWQPGKWRYGTVAFHRGNQWVFIEMDDGDQQEYDYRWIDVEDQRNSLVQVVKEESAKIDTEGGF